MSKPNLTLVYQDAPPPYGAREFLTETLGMIAVAVIAAIMLGGCGGIAMIIDWIM